MSVYIYVNSQAVLGLYYPTNDKCPDKINEITNIYFLICKFEIKMVVITRPPFILDLTVCNLIVLNMYKAVLVII